MSQFVTCEVTGGLAVITIDRPEKRHALSYVMLAVTCSRRLTMQPSPRLC